MHPNSSFSPLPCSLLARADTLILGVGSPLRSDDRAGLLFCDLLADKGLACVKCEYGIENCVESIYERKPKRLVIVDAALFNDGKPGDVVLTVDEDVEERISLTTTHSLPVKLVLKMLRETVGIEEVYIVGIYPRSLEIGEQVSDEVQRSLLSLAEKFAECFREGSIEAGLSTT